MFKSIVDVKDNLNEIKRGEIFFANITALGGSSQSGCRPVVVIQNDIGNKHSPTVIVALITSQKKRSLPTHVNIDKESGLLKESTILTEQTLTLDKKNLVGYIGKLNNADINKINYAIAVSMGLISPTQHNNMYAFCS